MNGASLRIALWPQYRAAVALPARCAQRVRTHAEAHPELKDARECARAGKTGHERLKDADARLDLHDAHETQHRRGGHGAVGVEHDRERVVGAPALAEIADVAGLEASPALAPAVRDSELRAEARAQCRHHPFFFVSDVEIARIAQYIEVEPARLSRRDEPLDHPLEIGRNATRVLVTYADEERGGARDPLLARNGAQMRRDEPGGVAREEHDREADRRIPETDRRPRERDSEEHQHHRARHIHARGKERRGHQREQRSRAREDENAKSRTPPAHDAEVRCCFGGDCSEPSIAGEEMPTGEQRARLHDGVPRR